MNKSLMTGIGIGVVVAAAAGAVASLSMKGEPSRAANVEPPFLLPLFSFLFLLHNRTNVRNDCPCLTSVTACARP